MGVATRPDDCLRRSGLKAWQRACEKQMSGGEVGSEG